MSQRRSQRKATSSRERLSAADGSASRGLRGPRGGEPGLAGTVLCMALALAAGAIFLALTLSPASFLSAYRQVEVSRISEASASGKPSETNWVDLRKAIAGRIANTALAVRRDALNNLVNTVIRVDELPGTVSMADADASNTKDQSNLLAGLCAAVVLDAVTTPSAPARPISATTQPITTPDSAELRTRFNGVELRVRRDLSTSGRTTLYNDDVAAVRRDVMAVYFSRADVLAATTEYAAYFAVNGHFAALPILQRRLNALAAALDSAGMTAEAKQCRAWVRRCLWELLTGERDPATRLLCADLLSTQVDLDAKAAQALRRLVGDYQDRAAAAPIDRADRAARSPAVLPDQYRTVLDRLATALSATLAGAGAWLAALICLLAALVSRRRNDSSETGTIKSLFPRATINWTHVIIGAICFPVAGKGLAWHLSGRGISEDWAIVSAIVSMVIGFVLPILFPFRHSNRPGRTVAALGIAVFLLVLVFIEPTTISWALRTPPLRAHPWIGVAVIAHLICFAALYLGPASWHRKTRDAAILSLCWLVVGAVGYQFHRAADDSYLSRVAEARADEFASRLGSDWQDRYLADIKKTILEERP